MCATMNLKSQISVEFIVISSIALVIFLFLFVIIDRRNDDIYSSRTVLHAREEAERLAGAINTIFLAGDGAQKTLSLPPSLRGGEDYLLNIYPSSRLVGIKWNYSGNGRQYAATLITADITGSLNSLKDRTLTISNSDGGIVVG